MSRLPEYIDNSEDESVDILDNECEHGIIGSCIACDEGNETWVVCILLCDAWMVTELDEMTAYSTGIFQHTELDDEPAVYFVGPRWALDEDYGTDREEQA